MEKSKTSLCFDLVSKTLSKVKAPDASLDYVMSAKLNIDYLHDGPVWLFAQRLTYIDAAGIFCLKIDNCLSTACDFSLVRRAEACND